MKKEELQKIMCKNGFGDEVSNIKSWEELSEDEKLRITNGLFLSYRVKPQDISKWIESLNSDWTGADAFGFWLAVEPKDKKDIEAHYRTYNVVFNDNDYSTCGIDRGTLKECRDYIDAGLNSGRGYFADYKGGTVSIYCNETDEEVFSEEIPQ